MPQSLSNLPVHLVFSTKDRWPFIANSELQRKVERYLSGVLKELKCPAIEIGMQKDHAHLLFNLGRTVSVAEVVEKVKVSSSKWIKEQSEEIGVTNLLNKFAWQRGYGIFAVSELSVPEVRSYILNQEEHHKKVLFQDELRTILKTHHIDYDERYVWD